MMLMLKMLVLKMIKKYKHTNWVWIEIIIENTYELSRDDTKQAKSLIFIVAPQVEQFPKVPKKKKR